MNAPTLIRCRPCPVRVIIENEVFGCEREEIVPGPIELILLNLGRLDHIRETVEDQCFGIELYFLPDATAIFRIRPTEGVALEVARSALQTYLDSHRGVLP